MDVYYSDELPQGIIFEWNGFLVIGSGDPEQEEQESALKKLAELYIENKEVAPL